MASGSIFAEARSWRLAATPWVVAHASTPPETARPPALSSLPGRSSQLRAAVPLWAPVVLPGRSHLRLTRRLISHRLVTPPVQSRPPPTRARGLPVSAFSAGASNDRGSCAPGRTPWLRRSSRPRPPPLPLRRRLLPRRSASLTALSPSPSPRALAGLISSLPISAPPFWPRLCLSRAFRRPLRRSRRLSSFCTPLRPRTCRSTARRPLGLLAPFAILHC